MPKRDVDIVVISDIHLGTYGCHARELLQYLKSIQPGMVVLNGDIIDIWAFSKRYWPPAHMLVIKHIIGYITNNIPVYYIPGNHDEMMRKFKDFQLGSLKIANKLSLKIGGQNIWIFHGDVFDVAMKHSKWLAKLGGKGYDMLILLNRLVNFCSDKIGRGKVSFSKKIKNSVKSAVSFIGDFERTVSDIAIDNNYPLVICGHIHQPCIKTIESKKGNVTYMNSGDWVENLTSLEYANNQWIIYKYTEDLLAQSVVLEKHAELKEKPRQMMDNLLSEFRIMK
jgi:UDP-2,3-diacylglucosamine pyrophosphatase LpxH